MGHWDVHNQSSLLNPRRNELPPSLSSPLSLLPIWVTFTLQNMMISFLFHNSLAVIFGIESKSLLFIKYSEMQETTPQLMKVQSTSEDDG